MTRTDLEAEILSYIRRAGDGERGLHLAGAGPVARLEARLERHFGMKHAVLTSSGTSALLAVALALEVRGAPFVTTPYTHGATISSFLLAGATPLVADLEPGGLTLDADAVRRVAPSGTRAILATDVLGYPCDDRRLRRVADELGAWYVADACQSLGARRDGRPASSLAHAVVTSFTVGKTVFAGEGGAVLTNDDGLHERIVWWSQHPARQRRELSIHLVNELGINARPHPLAAIWGNAIFDDALAALALRQASARRVVAAMERSGLVERQDLAERRLEPAFFRIAGVWRAAPRPSALLRCLEDEGFPARLAPLPVGLVHHQPSFLLRVGSERVHCPRAESVAARGFAVEILPGPGRGVEPAPLLTQRPREGKDGGRRWREARRTSSTATETTCPFEPSRPTERSSS